MVVLLVMVVIVVVMVVVVVNCHLEKDWSSFWNGMLTFAS